MSGTCETGIGLYLAGAVPVEASLRGSWNCGKPATMTIRAGCVHEHVREKRVCAEHGQANPAGAVWFCRACAELGHDCPVTPEVVVGE